jgi:hypothetical protein
MRFRLLNLDVRQNAYGGFQVTSNYSKPRSLIFAKGLNKYWLCLELHLNDPSFRRYANKDIT